MIRNNKIKYISLVISFVLIAVLIVLIMPRFRIPKDGNSEGLLDSKIRLECNSDGKFKVLILADVHANGTLPRDVQNNIKYLVDKEQPDLVIFTGDNTLCNNIEKFKLSVSSMVSYIESKKIPWCHVYGNHDDEYGVSKLDQQAIYESFDYCLSKNGLEELYGVGNYILPIYKHNSNDLASLVWCLDSGNYLDEITSDLPVGFDNYYPEYHDSDYDYIHMNQINWYKETSIMLEQMYGRKIPSLMAFHIPLQESYYAWCNKDNLEWTGSKNERVCSSRINSGLFDVLKERQDVLAVVNGHDHINDFMVKYEGIKLCYSPNVSTLTYYDEYMMGSRVFVFDENNPTDIETYIRYLFRN